MKAIVSSISQGLRQVRLLIEVIAGAVQPGLAKLVRRIVARHLRNNSEYCAYRYLRFVRLARWLVGHPVYALAIVSAPYAAAILLARFGYLHRFDFADAQFFLTVNVGTLTAQAALVGVVFPLIIAFVGLLNRGRASFASRLTIYIESSNAIFVGMSSLLLCVAMVFQLTFAGNIDGESSAFTLLNLVWFAINVGALAHFVLQTIAFLHPVRRAPIMRAYVANVIWPRELTGTVSANRWGNVDRYGYLPAGDEADPFGHGTQVRVWYMVLWDGGEPRVRRTLGKRVRLVDVRVAMLAPVVREWLARARLANDGRTHDFVIPLTLGHDYQGEQTLVRATLPLGPVARWAIRASLRFSKAPKEDGSINHTSAVLREMIADLIALIDTRQADEFKDQLRDVIDFHAFLFRLAQNSDDDLSYAQFGDGWGSTLSDDWARAYRDVVRRAVERVPEETEFVSRLAYAPALVYARVASEVTPKALQSLLTLAQHLAYRLIDWALGEYRAEEIRNIRSKHAFTLSRHGESYAHVWREFVAGWERLLLAIAEKPRGRKRGDRSWDDLKSIAENVSAHLRTTTQMVARAVWLGDTTATNWTSDLMLHWQIQAERAWGSRSAYWQVRSEALTPEILERDWAEVEKLPLTQDYYSLKESVVFGATIRNTWRDHVVMLASLCVHWAIHAGGGETAKQAARRLLNGEPYDRGDAGIHRDRGLSGTKILISVLRITGSGERFAEHSYRGRIDHLLEGLGQLGESPYVPMRIYTSSGGLSFEDLPRALAISMMATMSDLEAINGDLRRLLTQSDDEALRRREHYLQALLAAFDKLDADKDENLFSELVGQREEQAFDVRRDSSRNLVQRSLDILTNHRDQAIIEAQIDPARVEMVAAAAGSEAFTPTAFPHHLFAEIAPTADVLSEFTLSVNGLSKGAYTDPPMAQAVLNEEDWWRTAVSEKVAVLVWWDVVLNASFRDVEGRTPEEFWSAVREGSQRIREAGHDPILVIGSVTDPQWLTDWRWPHRYGGALKPADLVITRDEGQAEGYEFTMSGTPVYSAQTADGVAYLIPKQLLGRLRYHKYDNGLPVSLQFEPDSQNPWLGTMHATFQRDVE